MTPLHDSPKTTTRTQQGAALLLVAIVVGLLPWFPGPGWAWSFVLSVAALLFLAAYGVGDLQHPQHAMWSGIFTVAVLAHTHQLLYLGLGSLPWIAASLFLVAGQWPQLDASGVMRGYRLYVALGSVVGLLSLWGTWGVVSGWYLSYWMGGTQYNSVFNGLSGQYEMQLQWNPMQIPVSAGMPDIPFTGQGMPGALWAQLTLFALLGWSLRRDETLSGLWRTVALGSIALLLVWAFGPVRDGFRAPSVFFMALLLCAFGAWKTANGQVRGDFDPDDVKSRLKGKLRA